MEYALRTPNDAKEAVDIFEGALHVIYGQVEYYRGDRKKSWNGDFVTHMQKEAQTAIEWLRSDPTRAILGRVVNAAIDGGCGWMPAIEEGRAALQANGRVSTSGELASGTDSPLRSSESGSNRDR